jgi:methylated-DNA-protein-cysteine methyltransferase-like protein
MARFVGFVSRNSAASGLPWHRVVFKDGSLVPGWEKQQYKSLWAEGVRFSQNKKVIMEKYLWNKLADIPPDMRDWPLVF